MKYWKLLGHESEPKGIGKIMSICLFIVLLNGYLLEGFIDHFILDIISYTCIGVFFILLVYNFIRKQKIQKKTKILFKALYIINTSRS